MTKTMAQRKRRTCVKGRAKKDPIVQTVACRCPWRSSGQCSSITAAHWSFDFFICTYAFSALLKDFRCDAVENKCLATGTISTAVCGHRGNDGHPRKPRTRDTCKSSDKHAIRLATESVQGRRQEEEAAMPTKEVTRQQARPTRNVHPALSSQQNPRQFTATLKPSLLIPIMQ
jgi:hypothetical protein